MVLGPHRSGTSVVTRALIGAGFDLGRHLLEPNADNPKGFFENARIVEFNDALLKHLGLCWDYLGCFDWSSYEAKIGDEWWADAAALLRAEFGDAGTIAIKDPRLCFLAPFWDRVLQDAALHVQYVMVVRHPVESAESQHARYWKDPVFHHVGATLAEGVLLWANYAQAALGFLAGKDFVTASYADFLAHPEPALRRLAAELRLDLPEPAVREYVDGFLDESLRRHRVSDAADADNSFPPYLDAYRTMLAPGMNAAALRDRLRQIMASDPQLHTSVLRGYVQARHGDVEAKLELAKAGRIIKYQEYALAQAQQKLDERETLLIAAKEQFIAERREKDRLALTLATCQDRLPAGVSHGAPNRNPGAKS